MLNSPKITLVNSMLVNVEIKYELSDYPDFCPGLPVTGELDRGTLQLMRTPRCGVKDDVGTSRGRGRGRRFALQGGHTLGRSCS